MEQEKRILFIDPVKETEEELGELKKYLDLSPKQGVRIDALSLQRGPEHLEYHYYGALVAADLLHAVKKAENNGYDAAVIGCFYDPFLREAREICDRLVVTAPAESSLLLASSLSNRFSIIVGRRKWIPAMRENVLKYGFGEKLASFRILELGVSDFHANEGKAREKLIEEAREAVERDGAESLILGCTMQFGFYRELQELLNVPVIDVVWASLVYAEMLVDVRDRFGWKVSKKGGYETPPLKEIRDFDIEGQYGIKGLWL